MSTRQSADYRLTMVLVCSPDFTQKCDALGEAMARWQFKENAPVSFKVLFTLLAINFLGQFAADYAIRRWSPIRPDAAHSYLIRFKGGAVYFVQPWLGKYFDYGFWAHFVLLALGFLICWLHRDELERVR